jgi:transposase
MEATGIYWEELANFLYNINCKVSVVNPVKIKGFGMSELSRTKTDRADSKLIARFCKAIEPPAWQPIKPEYKELQLLVRRLEDLQNLFRIEKNHLETATSNDIKKSIESIIGSLTSNIEEITKLINNKINQNPELQKKQKLLETIPGIGNATIMHILSFINIEKFSNIKQLDAFLGLNPKQRQSGTSINGQSRISKVGNSNLRKTFYFPAIVAKKHNPIIKAFCERLKIKGKPTMVIICAAMRKLVHIIYGILKSGKAFDATLVKF